MVLCSYALWFAPDFGKFENFPKFKNEAHSEYSPPPALLKVGKFKQSKCRLFCVAHESAHDVV